MKIPKQEYMIEFKELTVKRVKDGQTVGAVAKELGLVTEVSQDSGHRDGCPVCSEAQPRGRPI